MVLIACSEEMNADANPKSKLIIFDCDSTLSAIEGVDVLGGLRGEALKIEVEALTNQAMAGEISIEAVFGKRLEKIRPRRDECKAVGKLYIEEVEPFAKEVVAAFKAKGWTPIILSGGFVPVIEPLADYLGIDRVEAVPLYFDDGGDYVGFDQRYPTTRNGGKTEIVMELKAEYQPTVVVMVGDGVSDLETKPEVDLFVGFGRYASRSKVRAGADAFIDSLDGLAALVARFE